MKKLSVLLVAFIAIIMISCQPQVKVDEKEQIVNRIDTLEYCMYNSKEKLLDDKKPNEVIHLYKEFIKKYPEDSMSVVYNFKAAQVELRLGKSLLAIKTLDSLIIRYPDAEIVPNVLQFKAYILDDRLNNYNEARDVLTQLIENYPESDLVDNAKAYRENLGKSFDEIIIKETEVK